MRLQKLVKPNEPASLLTGWWVVSARMGTLDFNWREIVKYRYMNNTAKVCDQMILLQEKRQTALSHFSYEISNSQILQIDP